jgi:hypothetical protein
MPAQVGDLHGEDCSGAGGERPGRLISEHAPVQGLVVSEQAHPEQALADGRLVPAAWVGRGATARGNGQA